MGRNTPGSRLGRRPALGPGCSLIRAAEGLSMIVRHVVRLLEPTASALNRARPWTAEPSTLDTGHCPKRIWSNTILLDFGV